MQVLEDLAAWSTCLLPAFWEQNLPVSYVPPEECMLEYVKMRCAESQAGDPSKRLISLVKSLPADQQSYSLLWQDSQGYSPSFLPCRQTCDQQICHSLADVLT